MRRTAFSPHDELYVNHLRSSQKHNMPVQHYHDSYEIYLQLDGKRYCFVDNMCYTLEPGDLMIYMPFELHYSESREVDYYERYVLNFHKGTLSILLNDVEMDVLLKKLRPGVVHLSQEQRHKVYEHFERIEEYSKQEGFLAKKLVYSSVLQFLMYIIKCVGVERSVKDNLIAPQIIVALEYINKNYQNKITLDEMAQVTNMSKYHLSRTFHSATGATVLEYITNVRLIKVHNLLLNTGMSLEEIANQTGFGSATDLARVFKKTYGVSPRTFRSQKCV